MSIKNEQIIVRLSPDKKKKLQEIADSLNIDMSKLIRDKIDEIIRLYNEKNDFKEAIIKGTKDEKTKGELTNRLKIIENEFKTLIEYINDNSVK